MAKKLAELLHAAVEIHAYGPVRQTRPCGDFGTGHAFNKTQDERFAIGIRQSADGLENLVSFGLIGAICGMRLFVAFVDLLVKFVGRARLAVKIDGAVSRNGGEPATKARDVAEGVEAGKRLEENILHEIFDRRVRNLREQNAVNHARVPGIELPERAAITVLCRLHQCDIASARLGSGVHGSQTRERRLQLKVG